METNTNNSKAQMSAEWKEREQHAQIIAKIDQARASFCYCECDYGHGSYWKVETLPNKTLREIIERGNQEEIVYLIKRYAACCPPERYTTGCAACHSVRTTNHILPEEIQELIAKRGNRAEIDAYILHNGFGAKGQDAILERGDHDEIMRYIARHGFLPEQQRKLKKRCNKEEWLLHIANHGLCEDLLHEMFDRIKAGGNDNEYYEFINRHELPVEQQKLMLLTVTSKAFIAYIERYGLWNESHATMISHRSDDEIAHYIKKHRYLSSDGEAALAHKNNFDLNMLYVSNRWCKQGDDLLYFMEKLLNVRPLDYNAIGSCFFKIDLAAHFFKYGIPEPETKHSDIELMKKGTHEQVMERIKGTPLCLRAFAELFFRDNPEEFEAYLDSHKKD